MRHIQVKTDDVLLRLENAGQSHLIRYLELLSENERETLLTALGSVDFDYLARANAEDQRTYALSPIEVYTSEAAKREKIELEALGYSKIGQGKVAALLLCGGDGTRLGFDHAKGMYNIGLTRELSIFELHFSRLLAIARRAERYFPILIMTSRRNHEEIREFLKEHQYFGYSSEAVFLFSQQMAPTTDLDGRLLLEDKTSLSVSPDGNGGWFSSLYAAGLLETVKGLGVEWLNVVSIDNVLGKIEDPIFIGATVRSGKECGAKVVKMLSVKERIGLICKNQGRPSVIEYYELDRLLQSGKVSAKGMDFGVILNYLFRLDSMERTLGQPLPVHKVRKKIPYYSDGERVIPTEENGYKYEMLATDLVERLTSCLPYEVLREDEFAPVKNRHGMDSVDSAREMLKAKGILL